MARNEQIICDACKKTWDRVQSGLSMWWETRVQIDYKLESATPDIGDIEGEVCSTCAAKIRHALHLIDRFVKGEKDVLEGVWNAS